MIHRAKIAWLFQSMKSSITHSARIGSILLFIWNFAVVAENRFTLEQQHTVERELLNVADTATPSDQARDIFRDLGINSFIAGQYAIKIGADYSRNHKPAIAVKVYKALLDVFPELKSVPGHRLQLAQFHLAAGDGTNAVVELEGVSRMQQNNGSLQNVTFEIARARAYSAVGRTIDAKASADRVLSYAKLGDPTAAAHLGLITNIFDHIATVQATHDQSRVLHNWRVASIIGFCTVSIICVFFLFHKKKNPSRAT